MKVHEFNDFVLSLEEVDDFHHIDAAFTSRTRVLRRDNGTHVAVDYEKDLSGKVVLVGEPYEVEPVYPDAWAAV